MIIYDDIVNMNKEKVLDILKDLKPYRELSEWMIALIDAGFMDKETYQNMLFMVSAAIKQMANWAEKERIKWKFDELKKDNEKENNKDL